MKITKKEYFYLNDLENWIGPVSSIKLVSKVVKGEIKQTTKIWCPTLCPNEMTTPSECDHLYKAIPANELPFFPNFLFKKKSITKVDTMINMTMFQAQNGDCFLITLQSDKEYNILIDTGFPETYDNQLLPRLQELSKEGKALDLCVITHIDEDHISGAISLFKQNGSNSNSKIISINEVWHNSFRHIHRVENKEKLNRQEQEQLTSIISRANSIIEKRVHGEVEVSAEHGSTLAAMLNKGNYNWNSFVNGDAICVENLPIFALNEDIKLTLLSPNINKLRKLEKWWEKELLKSGYTSDKFNNEQIFDDAFEFLLRIPNYQEDEVDEISLSDNIEKQIKSILLKDYTEDNSPPNGSSIAFILEFKDKKILFMGDAHSKLIEQSLRKLHPEGIIYFDAIKISHHGSIRNNRPELFEIIDSPIYLISTNSKKSNHPDLKTLAHIITRPTQNKRILVCNYKTPISEKLDDQNLKQEYNFEISYNNQLFL